MTVILADMIAAGGVGCLPARIRWPMHRALWLIYAEAGRTGGLHLLPRAPAFTPCPETGRAAAGADQGLRTLTKRRLLREEGQGLTATLVVDHEAVVSYRRSLMSRDPRAVAMLQRAGERWAAFASTAANAAASATESARATVVSAAA